MDCIRAQELMSEYIDGMLDDNMNKKIKNHIDTCSECGYEFKLLKEIISNCQNVDEVDLPDDFKEKLHKRLIEEKHSQYNKDKFARIKEYYKPVAALLVLAVTLGVVINSGIFKSQKKSMSPEAGSASTEMYSSGQPTAAAADGQDKADKSVPQNRYTIQGQGTSNTADTSNISYNIISINLGQDEYQDYYEGIVAVIEGMEGFLKQKEPPVYAVPQKYKDELLKKLNDEYKLSDISVSVIMISDRYAELESDIEKLQKSRDKAVNQESSSSVENIDKQITMKQTEMNDLNNIEGTLVIQINKK